MAHPDPTSSPARSRARKPLLDIPPRIRSVIVVLGLAGAVMVLVASLESAGGHKIETDKLLHFGGYFTVALLFVVGLPPRLFVLGILGLAGLGLAVEFLQPLQGRSRDMSDMMANGIGIAAGAMLGFPLGPGRRAPPRERAGFGGGARPGEPVGALPQADLAECGPLAGQAIMQR